MSCHPPWQGRSSPGSWGTCVALGHGGSSTGPPLLGIPLVRKICEVKSGAPKRRTSKTFELNGSLATVGRLLLMVLGNVPKPAVIHRRLIAVDNLIVGSCDLILWDCHGIAATIVHCDIRSPHHFSLGTKPAILPGRPCFPWELSLQWLP